MRFKKEYIIIIIIYICTLCLSGFRYDVGVDWEEYYSLFDSDEPTPEIFLERLEPINIIIKNVLEQLELYDGRYWIWTMAMITLSFIFLSIQLYSSNYLRSILLFFCLGEFFYGLNGIRQHCAIAIAMFAWQYIIDKKFFKYCLVILTAVLFHRSALIMLPLYFVARVKFSKQILTAIAICCIPGALLASKIVPYIMGLFPSYEIYSSEYSAFATDNGNILSYLRMVYPLSLFCMTMAVYDKLGQTTYERVFLNIALFGMLWSILFPTTMLMIRMSFYFQVAWIIFVPYLCSRLSDRNRTTFWYYTIIFNLIFLYFTQFSKPIQKVIPYTLAFDTFGIGLINLMLIVLSVLFIYVSILKINIHKK